MAHFKKYPLVLSFIAALFLIGCTDNEQAEEEGAALSERTEEAVERDPATESAATAENQQQGQVIPPPENVAAPPENAEKTQNGVAYIVLEDQATDISPSAADVVTVHYTGWTADGRMFDSSVARGEPATFPLNALIPGWQEAVPMMTVGDKYRFWIPGDLAYDSSNRPGAPKGMLVFDIELVDVQRDGEQQPSATGKTGS